MSIIYKIRTGVYIYVGLKYIHVIERIMRVKYQTYQRKKRQKSPKYLNQSRMDGRQGIFGFRCFFFQIFRPPKQ